MVCTMPSGVKWWLLRHGILASISGAFLLILFSLLTIIYALNFGFISFFVLILVISFGTPFLFSGFAYGNLYAAIRELPPSWVAEDFDLVRCRISLREGTKDYVVLYHGILVPYTYWIYLKHGMWLDWQQAPGHYQIWTPYRGGTHATRDRYSYLSYVRPSGVSRLFFPTYADSKQKETVFDEDLLRMVPHLHEAAKEISSLRFVGLAREGIETIAVALLTGRGDKQVCQVLYLLKKIVQDAEGIPPSSSEEWGWDE